jgi:hypothetical protein
MDVYTIFKNIHSYNRYIILALLAFVLIRSLVGWLGKRDYEKLDNATAGALVGFTHLQLVMGFILYGALSPMTQMAFQNMKAAMKEPMLRYWAVEHMAMMLLAVVFIQLARTLSKKSADATVKHKRTAICLLIAVVLVLGSLVPKGLLLTNSVAW